MVHRPAVPAATGVKQSSMKPETTEDYLISGCGRCELGGTPGCKVNLWRQELGILTELARASGLQEVIKWGVPCYTFHNRNVCTVSALKNCVVLSFFRGHELDDPHNILEKPGPHSRYARCIRFTSATDIRKKRRLLSACMQAAIAVEKRGARALASENTVEIPKELSEAFAANNRLKMAFGALTPGRQRGYLIYFTSAKQSKTIRARIEKCTARILAGKGWNEK